jgi:hypothetical protein
MALIRVEQESVVVQQPWELAPYKLWTLLEMLEFLASEWSQLVRSLEELTNLLNLEIISAMVEGNRAYFTKPLRQVVDSCTLLGLSYSASYAEELINLIDSSPTFPQERDEFFAEATKSSKAQKQCLAPDELVRQVSILKKRIDDELKNRKFLAISPGKAAFYRSYELFGATVFQAFPSATKDIEEAGTCYACGRSTAAVFHLMRVMEVGLRALGASLNNPDLDPRKNPSWERLLKPCDDELRKPIAERCPEWRTDDLFFSNATANLRAVKDAWRNPTLHVEVDYDDERAFEILNAVKAFMRHLASRFGDSERNL